MFVKIWVGKETWNHVPVFYTSTFQGIYKIARLLPLYIKLHSMIILYISLNSIHNKVNYFFPVCVPDIFHFLCKNWLLIKDKFTFLLFYITRHLNNTLYMQCVILAQTLWSLLNNNINRSCFHITIKCPG